MKGCGMKGRGMKGYREWNPRQDLLLPPSLLDWLPRDHAVYFVPDVVEELDLSAIEDAKYGKGSRGRHNSCRAQDEASSKRAEAKGEHRAGR